MGATDGATGGGSGTKKKKPNPRRQFIQAASKIARTTGPDRQKALAFLGDQLSGIPGDKLYKWGEKADLPPGDIDKIRAAQASAGVNTHTLAPDLLDIIDRPSQALKGSFVEPDQVFDVKGAVSGAWRGLSGKEKYSGSEAAFSIANATAGEADDEKIRRQVESLPGPVRMGTDFVADVVLDPTNAVTFGGGPLAENAAKAVAKHIAGEAAQRGLTRGAQEILEGLAKKGTKSLADDEVRALRAAVGEKVAKRLLRRANKAQGGMYLLGKKVPGSQLPQQAARTVGVLPEGWGSRTEMWLRTEAASRQGTRAGILPEGTPGTVQSINEGRRASNTAADLAAKETERRAATAVGRQGPRTWYGRTRAAIPDSVDVTSLPDQIQRDIIRAGERALKKAGKAQEKGMPGELDLDAVRESLDVNGGPAAIAALPDAERALATELRAILDEDFVARVESGRVMETDTARRVLGDAAAREDLGKAAGLEPRLAQLEKRRLAAQERVAAYQARVDALNAENEFVDVPALARPNGPDYFPKSDITRTKRIGEAKRLLEREKTRLAQIVKIKDQVERRMARSLVRSEGKRVAAADAVVPQDRYFQHFVTDEAKRAGFGRARRDTPASNLTSGKPGFVKGRKFKGAASESTTPLGDPTYVRNPVVAVGRSARQTAADAGRIQMFDEMQRMPGVNGQPIVRMGDDVAAFKTGNATWADEYVELKQPVARELPDGRVRTVEEPVLIQKDVVDDFRKVIEAKSDILENVRWLNSMWARWATATTGFVSRNVLQGNIFMGMVLAEAHNPKVWVDTLAMFKRINRGLARYGDPYRFIDDADRAVVEQAMAHGVISSGFYDDLAAATARVGERRGAVLGGKWSPLSPNFRPIERISAANQWAENWSRLSVFRNKLQQGFTPAEAALVTDHYMLNYRNLSKVNDAGRIVSPFLTWVYKSTPMILGEVARSPWKALIPLAFGEAIDQEGRRDLGNPLLPGWMEQGGVIATPDEFGPVAGGRLFTPDSPLHSAARAMRAPLLVGQIAANEVPGLQDVVPDPSPNVWGDLMGATWDTAGVGGVPGGVGKSIIEGMTGEQLFTGREFPEGEQVPVPGYTQVTGDKVPFQVRLMVENLFPLAGRAATFAPTSEYEKSVQGRRLLSMFAGVNAPKYDPSMTDTAFRERLKLLEAFVKKMRSEGSGDVPRRVNSSGGGGATGGASTGTGRSSGRPSGSGRP